MFFNKHKTYKKILLRTLFFFGRSLLPLLFVILFFFKVNPKKKKLQKSFSLQKNVKRKDFEYKKQ